MILRFSRALPVLCGMISLAAAQTQTNTYSYTGSPLTISGKNANVSTVAEIYVPATVTVSNVTVQLNVQFPAVGDLVVYLFSPNNTRTVLLDKNCASLANINTTFDDSAQSRFSEFCPQEAGRGPFRGNEPLANSRGEFAAGNWQLVVQNTESSRTGLINSFSITVTGTPVTQPTIDFNSVVNAASGQGDVVAPGELITIFGVALGPQQGVSSNAGTQPTSLAGTTVTFDGNPVPILYASYYQVNAQVPFSLSPGSTTQVRVQASGGTSNPVLLDVLSSAVGLFTNQTNGRGQILAVNQDGTINSSDHPVSAGSYISLYGTGLGSVSPGVAAGTPAPSDPLSRVSSGIAQAVVGGVSSPVTYAGLAPGYVGLYQINIQVPATVPSGQRRVFLVSPNGYASQTGTYIQVK